MDLTFVLKTVLLSVFIQYMLCSELLQYDKNKQEDVQVKASDKIEEIQPAHNGVGNNKKPTDEVKLKVDAANQIDFSFVHAFVASLSVIIVSELGDKTFFIAAIMAMRHSRLVVFIGAIGALGLMTVLSVFLGYATTVIPRKYTFYISTALFAIFGLKMLKEGYEMDPNEGQEELEEVQAELKKKEAELEALDNANDVETGIIRSKLRQSYVFRFCRRLCSPIFVQSFTMTFLAEWGDRSQLTTIILGSRENPLGVTVGGILGHALCTALAVLGGRLIAQKISVRTVTFIGGIVFLIFAASAFFIGEV